jgi:ATP phosphoribosyltransferase regulatory subunit
MNETVKQFPAHHAQWPLPQGVVDLVYQDAASKRDLQGTLRACFRAWSYDELIPPTFEYADTLASEAGTQLAEEMYRFTDRDGRTLALRPDLTIPAARVVATRLHDQPMPLRLFYVGSVFRYEAPQAGRQREFTQAGVELFGAGTPAADAEVLALTVEALHAAGLRQFQLALGQMAFFRGLLAELDAPAPPLNALQGAIDRKNPADLAHSLDQLDVSDPLRRAFVALPQLNGGPDVLQHGQAICVNPAMRAALDWLAAIHDLLVAYGVADAITFDLGETRGMEYYTGITFKGYTPGLGFSICSGGRYDDLVGHFGRPQPAVGCALWVDRILLARQRQGWRPASLAPTLLWAADACPDCLRLLLALRRRGLRVELDVTGAGLEELSRRAISQGTPYVAECRGAGAVTLRSQQGMRQLTLDELAAEAAAW